MPTNKLIAIILDKDENNSLELESLKKVKTVCDNSVLQCKEKYSVDVLKSSKKFKKHKKNEFLYLL